MVEIIRLYADPHRQVQVLLPWYASGSLAPDEAGAVAAHLETCAACRAELDTDRALARAVAALPVDAAFGWGRLRDRALSAPPPERDAGPGRGLLERRISLGAALAAVAATLALTIGAAWGLAMRTEPATYRALSAPSAAAPAGNIVVIFQPSATEQQLRTSLLNSGARVVDGPTASDAFVLRAPPQERAAALNRLRADRHVVMAEPIDPDEPQ